jgi:hypothetical protein
VTVKDLQAGSEARTGIADNSTFRQAGKAGQQVVPRSDLVAVVRGVLQPMVDDNQTPSTESEPAQ